MLNIGKNMKTLSLMSAIAGLFQGGSQLSSPPARKRSWRDNVSPQVYRHQMITASPREIAAWNKNVVAAKSKRRESRRRRAMDAMAALSRSAFDTLREYRHGVRNYVVAKAGG